MGNENVLFRKLGKSEITLPAGGIFSKKGKDKIEFQSPGTNITYYHYTNKIPGVNDYVLIQHQHQQQSDKLMLYAFIREGQYNVVSCGFDCHLWIQSKHKNV